MELPFRKTKKGRAPGPDNNRYICDTGHSSKLPNFTSPRLSGQQLSPTKKSAIVNICMAQDILLLPGETPLHVATKIWGLIPPYSVGLLLGCSTLTSKEVTIHTVIIDSKYKEKIQITMSSSVSWSAKKNTQLLLLP